MSAKLNLRILLLVTLSQLFLAILPLQIGWSFEWEDREPYGSSPAIESVTLDAPIPLSGYLLLHKRAMYLAKHYPHRTQQVYLSIQTQLISEEIGDTHTFWATNYNEETHYQLDATLKRIGEHCYVYLENGLSLSDDKLDNIVNEFDNTICSKVRSVFGDEWRPGIDGDDRLTLLLLDIRGDWVKCGMALHVNGFFSPDDEYIYQDQDPSLPGYYSNEREMLYMDVIQNDPSSVNFFGTIAHEFQHLINWYQDENEELWVNEGCSNLAKYLCGYGHPWAHINGFINNPDIQLTWKDYVNTNIEDCEIWKKAVAQLMAQYGSAYLWTLYFWEKYGGDDAIHSLVTNGNEQGISGYDTVLMNKGYSDRFPDVFRRWIIANYLNDPTIDAKYDYTKLSYEEFHVSAEWDNWWNPLIPIGGEPVTIGGGQSSPSPVENFWAANYIKVHFLSAGSFKLQTTFEGDSNSNFVIPLIHKEDPISWFPLLITGGKKQGVLFTEIPEWPTASVVYIVARTEPGGNGEFKLDLVESIPGIDTALVLDRSGSMGTSDKLPRVKQAAKYFIDSLQAGDQITISAFSTTVYGVAPLTLIPNKDSNDPVKVDLKNRIDAITASGSTNFGAGLQLAYNELIKSTRPEKYCVFMSNGQHNTGTYTSQVAAFKTKGWPIYTVGFGSDVNESSLRWIASETGGSYFPAVTTDIQAIYALIQSLITGQSTLASIQSYINLAQTVIQSILIPSLVDWVKFALFWPGSDMDLILVKPDGTEVTPDTAATDPDVDYVKSSTYAFYEINNPMPGEWKAKITATDAPTGGFLYNLNVSATSEVSTNFLAFEPSYNPGASILVRLSLREKVAASWQPILGCTVDADVTRPNASVENLILTDSGTNGDAAPNDGIYSAMYANTNLAGAYLITANATGSAISGAFTSQAKKTVQVGDITQQISIDLLSLKPTPGSEVEDRKPLISATIIGPSTYINISTIELKVDGIIVPYSYDGTNQVVSYMPSVLLSDASHTVGLNLQDTFGRTVSASWSFTTIYIPANLRAIEYRYGSPKPGYKFIGNIFESWLQVRIENTGQGDAYNVIAAIAGKPANVMVADNSVTIGDIPSGSSAWSSDTFTLTVDLSKPQNRNEGIFWRIEYDDSGGNHHIMDNVPQLPAAPALAQRLPLWYPRLDAQPPVSKLYPNYPNPFNPETWIPYQITEAANVTVRIFDAKGQTIETIDIGHKEAGFYISKDKAAYWDGKNVFGEKASSGVYFYSLDAGKFTAIRKMVIVE